MQVEYSSNTLPKIESTIEFIDKRTFPIPEAPNLVVLENPLTPSSGLIHESLAQSDLLRRTLEASRNILRLNSRSETLISSLTNRKHLCIYVEASIQAFQRNIEAAKKLIALEKDSEYQVKAEDLPGIQRLYGSFDPTLPIEAQANKLFQDIFLNPECRSASYKPENIEDFFARVFLETALINPQFQSGLRLLQASEIYDQDRDFTPLNPVAMELNSAFLIRNSKLLSQYDQASLTPYQQFCKKVFEWYFNDEIRGIPFNYHSYPINQLEGLHIDLPLFFADVHLIRNKNDAENYLARLSKVDRLFEGIMQIFQIQDKLGVYPPKLVFDKIFDQISSSIPEDITKNQIYNDFMQKVKTLPGITDGKLEVWSKRITTILSEQVYPAYQELYAYFKLLQPKITSNHGVDKLPNGKEYYAWVLRHHTTTNLTPQEIHQLGLNEVERLENMMWKALAKLGKGPEKTIEDHINDLSVEFCYKLEDGWKEKALADFESIGVRSAPLINKLFDLKPKASLVTKPVPEEMGDGTAFAFYNGPSFDGSIPGTTYVNIYNHEEVQPFRFSTLFFHEGVPGHHFQIALQQELPLLPLMIASSAIGYNGFCEGWALYVEELMWEYGWYHDPIYNTHPADEVGFLADALLRASRLVVDTGIHAMDWSRESAIDYMNKHSGQAKKTVTSEIDRYFVLPGQACSYKIGHFKIKELRELAKQELGSKFDIRQFHNVVLENGCLPLEVLEEMVKAYIAKVKGNPV